MKFSSSSMISTSQNLRLGPRERVCIGGDRDWDWQGKTIQKPSRTGVCQIVYFRKKPLEASLRALRIRERMWMFMRIVKRMVRITYSRNTMTLFFWTLRGWIQKLKLLTVSFLNEYVDKICEILADSASTKYVVLKLPLMSDHISSFEALVKRMSAKIWVWRR